MMNFQGWTDTVAQSLGARWMGVAEFVPNFLGALVVFVVGLIVATGLSALVEKVLSAAKLDEGLSRLGLAPYFERAGVALRASFFVGRVVFWFLVVVFLLAASDALGLGAFSGFLHDVLLFVPNVVAAALIMLASVVLANFAKKLVAGSVMSAKLKAGGFLGSLSWWSISVFGFFAALVQLNVAASIINALVTGFIAMLALAGGLAFGLGGKEYAAHLLSRLREQTEK